MLFVSISGGHLLKTSEMLLGMVFLLSKVASYHRGLGRILGGLSQSRDILFHIQ